MYVSTCYVPVCVCVCVYMHVYTMACIRSTEGTLWNYFFSSTFLHGLWELNSGLQVCTVITFSLSLWPWIIGGSWAIPSEQQKGDVFVQADLDLDTTGVLEHICSASRVPAHYLWCDPQMSIDITRHQLRVKISLRWESSVHVFALYLKGGLFIDCFCSVSWQ